MFIWPIKMEGYLSLKASYLILNILGCIWWNRWLETKHKRLFNLQIWHQTIALIILLIYKQKSLYLKFQDIINTTCKFLDLIVHQLPAATVIVHS